MDPAQYQDLYKALAEPFDSTSTRTVAGVELTYITGEQVTTRLNKVLGFESWSFEVKEHGFNQEADEFWAVGRLTVTLPGGHTIWREQAGSQKVKRSRATDTPIDIGFDLKGAMTDALKKCASLIGVGLYLSHKEEAADQVARAAAPATPSGAASAPQATGGPLKCAVCNAELEEIKFRDGTTWAPAQLAQYGRRKHGKVLCMEHYREANDARKRAEQSATSPSSLNELPV